MGTTATARSKIAFIREVMREAHEKGIKIFRKKIEAQIGLKGSTARYAHELIQKFIDAEEVFEIKGGEEVLLMPNPAVYEEEQKRRLDELAAFTKK